MPGAEALKRLSCKWKGRTDACEVLHEARVARLVECRKRENKRRVTTNTPAFSINPPVSQEGSLIDFMFYSQKAGFSDATTRTRYKILKLMAKHNVNLSDHEAVKLFIATRKEWSSGHKQIAVYAYDQYAKMQKIQWTPPFYDNNKTLPFVQQKKRLKHS